MKFEKRDITLNEADSLRDMLNTEKNVLAEYARALECNVKKQTQNELIGCLHECATGLCEMRVLLFGVLSQGEE